MFYPWNCWLDWNVQFIITGSYLHNPEFTQLLTFRQSLSSSELFTFWHRSDVFGTSATLTDHGEKRIWHHTYPTRQVLRSGHRRQGQVEEEQHICQALSTCGYPRWAFDKVKKQIQDKRMKGKKKPRDKVNKDRKTKGMVVIPYVKGLSESLERVFRKHQVATAMKPHQTIRHLLVHPKDKQDICGKSEVIYKIESKNCEKAYIGEMGRKFGTRLSKHMKDCEQHGKKGFTHREKQQSLTEMDKSAINDHINSTNHIIDWEGLTL